MLAPYSRFIIRMSARSRSDAKWLIRSLWLHAAQARSGVEFTGRRVRNLRLALGQHFLLRAINRPFTTIAGPVFALAIYVYLLIAFIASFKH